MDCYRPIVLDEGTASFPKAQEYPKMKIGDYEFEEVQQDLYTEECCSGEQRVSAQKRSAEESTSEGSLESVLEDSWENQQNVNRSGSHLQTSQTLR